MVIYHFKKKHYKMDSLEKRSKMEEELSKKCKDNLTVIEVLTMIRLIEIVDGFESYWADKPGQVHFRANELRENMLEAIELLNYPNSTDEKRLRFFIQKWYTTVVDTDLKKKLVIPRKASEFEKNVFCKDRKEFSDNSKWVWKEIHDRTKKLVESNKSVVEDDRATKKRKKDRVYK